MGFSANTAIAGSFILVAAALCAQDAAAQTYTASDDAFRLETPQSGGRATGGTLNLVATGSQALDAVDAPANVCPAFGEPTDADFQAWFVPWSSAGLNGYAMANNPASFVPILVPKPELADGAIQSFFVGGSPVKRVAMCIYPLDGGITQSDVTITLTRRGTSEAACGNVATPPCEVDTPITDPLNNLIVLAATNQSDVEYVITVEGPADGSIGITLGGRLGEYPTLGFGSN